MILRQPNEDPADTEAQGAKQCLTTRTMQKELGFI
jgi:hypothetical protein